MEWKEVLEVGLGPLAFIAFLKLVFSDIAELRQALKRVEEAQARTNVFLQKIADATEALARKQDAQLKLPKEEKKWIEPR